MCVGVAVRRCSFGRDAPHIVSLAERRRDDARVGAQDRSRVCNACRLREVHSGRRRMRAC
eukprot:4051218-Pleurochrysis_carterae.AAC.1